MMVYDRIETRQGEIAFRQSRPDGFPVLMLHGNSSCSGVFDTQFQSALGEEFRLISPDLLGHGASSDARNPAQAYSIPGFASTIMEFIDALAIARTAVLGWSLGGHIAIELMERDPRITGAMIVGTPPHGSGILGLLRGFRPQFDLTLTTKGRLTSTDVDRLAHLCFGPSVSPRFRDAIMRTDWRARRVLGAGMIKGVGVDQRRVAENSPIPLAIVNGEDEPFARLDYLSRIPYANLWQGKCHTIANAGHAPFLDHPQSFNPLFERFIADASTFVIDRGSEMKRYG